MKTELVILSNTNFQVQLDAYTWIAKNYARLETSNRIEIPVDIENPVIYYSVISKSFWRGTQDMINMGRSSSTAFADTVEEFISAVSSTLDAKFSKKEMRVYIIDWNFNNKATQLSDKEFMDLAEEDGEVYTLKGYEEAVNEGAYFDTSKIRFVEVETFV